MTSPNLFNFHSLVSLYIYTHYKRIVNFVSQSQRSLYNLTTESLPYFASNDTEPLPSAGQTFEFATSIDYVSLRSVGYRATFNDSNLVQALERTVSATRREKEMYRWRVRGLSTASIRVRACAYPYAAEI